MSQNGDELKFRKAYADRVEFKSFNEKTPEIYSNSRFSLIRELATEAAPAVTDIKSAASVKELLSVTPKNEREEREAQTRVALSASASIQKKKASSLKSFLIKNSEEQIQDKVSPLTDKLPAPAANATSHKEGNNTVAVTAANAEKTSAKDISTEPKEEISVANESIVVKKQSKPFSSLFRSSITSEFRGRKTDSLQDLYKRLLNN
ncbi:hypothetical protein [uncultured Succinivibrio sp.]|uniref:hypothetical protein n=1 Tax=uncultured Succinivibrio sp. TaxID=540749 RepID=UPI0025EFC7E5|nr:hypothetical protein [uncultured Succinivibrio sp.]